MAAAPKGKAKVEKAAKQLERLAVEYVSAARLKPNDYNPNRQSAHDFRLLFRSMAEDGFTQPIIAHKSGVIVDGEHRWTCGIVLAYIKANKLYPAGGTIDQTADDVIEDCRNRRLECLEALGDSCQIPAVFVDMPLAQMKIATLRHNRARGSEDVELGAEVLRDLQRLGALDWAIDSLDLSMADVDLLMQDIGAPEALAGAEFSEGWAPSGEGVVAEGGEKVAGDGITTNVSATREAVEAMRKQEQAISIARTEEERQFARKELTVYRVSVIFSGDEADVVRGVLGDQPAQTVLALCQREAAAKGPGGAGVEG